MSKRFPDYAIFSLFCFPIMPLFGLPFALQALYRIRKEPEKYHGKKLLWVSTLLNTITLAALPLGLITMYAETHFKQDVAGQVASLCDSCRTMGTPQHILIRGKVLVWDMRSGSESSAERSLPSELRVTRGASSVTVFMIVGERKENVGTYSISHQPGYRQLVDLCVVYWPDKKPIGVMSVVSREPRPTREVRSEPEYGDIGEPIARAIENLYWKQEALRRTLTRTKPAEP